MITRARLLLPLAITFSLGACSSTQHHNSGATKAGNVAASRASLIQALAEADRASANGLKNTADQMAYKQAVEKSVTLWLTLSDEASRGKGLDLSSGDRSYKLQASWPKNLRFDVLIPASTIKTKELKHHFTRNGLGAPFVAHWKYTEERKAKEPFITKGAGYMVPVTATLEFHSAGKGARTAALVLHDPRMEETVRLSGRQEPLAADFSAFGEYLLAQKAGQMSGLGALKHADKNLDKLGIIALQHPSNDRIPVIFVHGLMSRPRTWQNVFNELGADPVLQKKYQLYFFRYPSGVPVLYSAKEFRAQLEVLHDELERQGNQQAGHHMVLIGHSMGGLVSKSQVQQSGDRLWVNFFGDKPEKLGMSPEEITSLRQYFEFNPNPYVDRVIFVATPHRGSTLATGTIGAFARSLVSLPGHILGNTFDVLQGQAPQNPQLVKLLKNGIPSSVDNLSPTSQYVKVSTSLPLRPGIHVHSIVGNKKALPVTDPKCSDGIVPYTSAHLDGVESELVVHSGHSAHETAEAVAEITRILKLHINQL